MSFNDSAEMDVQLTNLTESNFKWLKWLEWLDFQSKWQAFTSVEMFEMAFPITRDLYLSFIFVMSREFLNKYLVVVSSKVDLEKWYSRKTIQIFGLRLVLFHFIQFHTICELTRLQFIPGSAKHKNRFESSLASISIETFKSEWLQK